MINNSPSEEIRKLIEEENIDIAYIGNKTNLGFTGGANQGIDYAMKHGANYVGF